MLVATRDPFHDEAHRGSSQPHAPGPSGGGRFMGMLQMAGALLAIPVGLASAYTMYRANFSVETSCQSLRAGIIATLDKNVDAATRRMLVRRDVATFEQTCAGFDPDATAAFKSLLAVAVPARAEAPTKEAVRKPEPRPEVAAKPQVANVTPVAAAPARRDAAVSDTKWLEAVRGALVDHASEPSKPVAAVPPAPPVANAPPPAPKPIESSALGNEPAQAIAPSAVAPALPPATSVPAALPVAAAPVVKRDADHPVPPESIPGAPPLSLEPKSAETSNRSRLGELIADIPLLGRVIEPKGN